jgi:hypothetical protein
MLKWKRRDRELLGPGADGPKNNGNIHASFGHIKGPASLYILYSVKPVASRLLVVPIT